MPSRATCYRRFEHYRAVEWAFVQLAQFLFDTQGKAACRPFVRQARLYNRLAVSALLGRPKAHRSSIPLD